jgi:outer membrane protein insertion porin family/translocation and assembly module TamA
MQCLRARLVRGAFTRSFVAGLLLAAATAALPAQARNPVRQSDPEVTKLTIRGVKHVDQHDLEKSIATQATRCRSLLLQPFCLFSKSPIFVEHHRLDRDEMRRDVLRIRVYYWRRGYREATVDTTVGARGKGVNVTFDIHEGEPTVVAAIRIDYDTTLVTAKRANKLTVLKPGQPLSMLALDSTRLNFQNEMWDRGFADAIVDTAVAVNDSTRRAAVGLRVFPNWPTTVGTIVIRGNNKVATETILNMLSLKVGQPFVRNDVLESQRTLYTSNLFQSAAILPPTGDSIKRIEVQVVEAPLHDARVGAAGDNINFAQLQATYSAHNLLGGARRLDINGTVGNLGARQLQVQKREEPQTRALFGDPGIFLQPTWSASIDFTQPAFLRRPANQLGLGIFAHRRSENPIYIDRGYGATATFTRQLSTRAPASLTYRYEVTRVEAGDVYFCVNYGVCDTATIRTLRSHENLSPLTLTAFVDRSDQAFTPTKGYIARFTAEHASRYTLSGYRYNRALLDAAAYWHPSLHPQVVAGHLRLGIVRAMTSATGDTVLHPRTRFYAGGAMSVRGFGENQLGPRVLTISADTLRKYACPLPAAITQCNPNIDSLGSSKFTPRPTGGTSVVEGSVEVRIPVYRHVDAAFFVDGAIVGSASLQGFGDLKALADFAHGTSAITPGAGIRYNSPVGPIRIDLGYNPKLTENLPVITNETVNGVPRLVALEAQRTYMEGKNTFLGRLVLHLSIGQAY